MNDYNELPVKKLIAKVLLENQNGYLDHEQIAEIGYGNAFVKATKKHLIGLIKRSMSHAIALLSDMDEGYLVVKLFRDNRNGSKLNRIVEGYKIADQDDIDEVKENLTTLEKRLESSRRIQTEFIESAKEKGLLTD